MDSFLPPPPSMRFELSNGISIAADSYGHPGDQPVLFLHGGGQTRHAWGGTAEALADRGFYAICMDHRGHGDSSWAGKGEYQLEDFVGDLLAVVEQLADKPILVGASLGGITALLAATERPIAKGLILVDVTPRLESEGVERIIGFMKGGAGGFASLEEAADSIARYLPHRQRPKSFSGLAKNLRLMEDGRYHWHWDPEMLSTWERDRYSEADELELRERLSHIRHLDIPTLLIRGRLSDLVSTKTASEFLDMVPHAEYVDLADAHHMVAGDQNDAFTDTVVEFLLRRFAPMSKADEPRAQRNS